MTKRLVKTLIFSSIAWSSISLSSLALGEDKYRYKEGDCITPTNESWSWYQGIATVQGVFKRLDDGYIDGEAYFLIFVANKHVPPWRKYLQPGMFSVFQIDANTQLLPDWMCSPD